MPLPDTDWRPDPLAEIRMTALQSLHGANYWSTRPVTRMDLAIGAYEDISSASVPGFTDALAGVMPALVEHRCSIGQREGFIMRLRRGTYAPHIIEHVALELQSMIGHDVGYGKSRGGDQPGEYTVVFEHRHSAVGLRAAALALEVVQLAFAGALTSVRDAVEELRSIADTPDRPAMWQHVLCGISGGSARPETRSELLLRGLRESDLIVNVAPSFILQAGLPYSRAEVAIILDTDLPDVPERYREKDRAVKLMSVLIDAVWQGGVVICPAREWEIQDYARHHGCRVAVFATDEVPTAHDRRLAYSVAYIDAGRVVLEATGTSTYVGPLREDVPAVAQLAATLATVALQELKPELIMAHGPR